jgi:DNA-binding response OmpR family regulator
LNTLVNFESALLGLDGQFSVGVNTLRKKLSACGAPDDAIRTLRGFGYALSCSIRLM